jgi:nitrous oxidase accessory protein NosD
MPITTASALPGAEHAFAINSDSELLDTAIAMGWHGSGTVDDPIIVDKVNFTTHYSKSAFYLGNTTLHLKIRDCIFTDQATAIALSSTANVSLEGCVFRSSEHGLVASSATATSVYSCVFECSVGGVVMVDSSGIDLRWNTMYVQQGNDTHFLSGLALSGCRDIYAYQSWFYNGTNSLENCRNATFTSCDFRDCEAGLDVLETNGLMIFATTMNNGFDGVVLGDNSTNVTMIGSNFNSCSIRFDATDEGTYRTLMMEGTFVRGKAFYMLKDVVGGTYTTDAHQLLIFNVTGATVSNVVAMETNAITLSFCRSVTVSNCSASGIKAYGVRVIQSQGCIIRECSFTDGLMGVELIYWGSNNRVESSHFNGCREGVGVHQKQEAPEVNGNEFASCALGIYLGGPDAFASSNSMSDCSMGGIAADDGKQVVIISNRITRAGYGIRLGYLNGSYVQQNIIEAASTGVIVDTGNQQMYISDNYIANCTSYAVRVNVAVDGLYIVHNRFISNNGAGATYSSSHIQARDALGEGIWNDTWGNYWSDWTADATSIGPYRISDAASDAHPYPMLRCGPPSATSATVSGNNVTIKWSLPSYPGFRPVAAYNVYAGGGPDNMTLVSILPADATGYNDRGVADGTHYYRVAAVNEYGVGMRTDAVEAKVGGSSATDNTLLYVGVIIAVIAIVGLVLFLRKRK